jgi:hypothetical protein
MGCSGSSGNNNRTNVTKDSIAVQKLLQSTKVSPDARLTNQFILNLDKMNDSHAEFLKNLHLLKFPNIKTVSMTNMSKFSTNEVRSLNDFFGDSFPNTLDYLHISSGAKPEYPNIDAIFFNLCKAASNAEKEVFIDGFEFNAEQFQLLVSKCQYVESLVFLNCNIKIVKGSRLNLGANTDYSIQHLDFFNSYYPKDRQNLNTEGLDVLAKAISETSLRNSLQSMHLTSYRNKNKVESNEQESDILRRNNINCKLLSDNEWPNPSGSMKNKTTAEHW